MSGLMAGVLSVDAAPAARPVGFERRGLSLSRVTIHEAAPVELSAVLAEDRQREQAGGPVRFAVPEFVSILPSLDGTWEPIDSDTWLWRQRIRVPGARSISLGFGRYHMPTGGRLFIYSVDGTEVLGPFTAKDNAAHGQLWTPLIRADAIVLEVSVPAAERAELDLELTRVNRGYRDEALDAEKTGLGSSGACNIDVICPEGDGWRDEIRSVARYQISLASGTFWCTGTLVNNTAEDDTPYFLTAFHCFDEYLDGTLADPVSAAASMVVYWNFEASTCGGLDGSTSHNQSGAVFHAAYNESDVTLVQLDDDPLLEFDVYFAGWDRADASPTSAVAIHHPQADQKKISLENDAVAITSYLQTVQPGNATHLRVLDWDSGTTEPGSSGCPLFSSGHRLVGQLHGGYAACGNNESDWFGRFYVSWAGGGTTGSRLSDWLDPIDSGVVSMHGKDPGASGNDPYEPDNSSSEASPVLFGVSQTHNIQPAVDVDWVTFTLTAESQVVIETSGNSGDTRLWLYDASLTEIDYDDDGGDGSFSHIDRLCGEDALPAGTYFVKVDEAGNDEEIIGYSLSILAAVCPNGCCWPLITTYPDIQGFEDDWGNWTNLEDDQFDWTRTNATTPSTGTGPSQAHSGSWFVFTEATGHYNQLAVLDGPCFDFSGMAQPAMRFWYHMYGSNMGTLSVRVSDDNCGSFDTVWSLSGNQGNNWYETQVDLSSYSGKQTKIRFHGLTGTTFLSDMAIDDILVGSAPLSPPAPTASSNSCGDRLLTRGGTPPQGVTWYWQVGSCGTATDLSGAEYTATESGTYYMRALDDVTGLWSPGCGLVSVTVQPLVLPDFDGDCDVDSADYSFFESCASGPEIQQPDPQCDSTDLDTDGDVDHTDFGLFQRCFSGANHTADAGCDD